MMMGGNPETNPGFPQGQYPAPARSEISFNLSEANEGATEREAHYDQQAHAERELLNMALNAETSHQIKQPEPLDANARKIDSKDSMWKPAPIMGRGMDMGSTGTVNQGAVNHPIGSIGGE